MKLPNKFTMDTQVLPSQVDFQCKLGYYETFRFFMDLANRHATILGVGQSALMDKNLFWLTVKTRIKFFKRPLMGADIQAQTWPVKPGSLRTDRCYRLLDDEGLIAEGRTEWAVMDMDRLRLAPVGGIFPAELEFNEEEFSVVDFPRVAPSGDDCPAKGTYRVTSSDIDMGLHMNNAAYIRALIGMFPVSELKDMEIADITVIFKTSAHEGDELTYKEVRDGKTIDCGLYFPDGKSAVLARIVCR